MTRLELSFEEAAQLAELIENSLGDLSMEIADTDSYDFRQGLKARRDTLSGVLEKLRTASAAQVEPE